MAGSNSLKYPGSIDDMIKVKKIIIHPNFNHLFAEEGQEPPQNDIAILNLETKLDLKPGIVQAIGIEDGGFSPAGNYFIELIEQVVKYLVFQKMKKWNPYLPVIEFFQGKRNVNQLVGEL